MKMKSRLDRLEKMTQLNDPTWAFFSIPEGLTKLEQSELEKTLWHQYLKDGGNPNFIPAFQSGLSNRIGFLWCLRVEDLRTMLAKTTTRDLIKETRD